MPNNRNDFTEFYTHKMVVDYLKEDGAICDSNSKTYDINKTAEGGEGGRLAFKKINDKINQYHEVLKFLDGEERANIYESIPVIDFVHKENTGFLESYYSDESGLYSMIIKDVPLYLNKKSDLDLIREHDPYTINRALAGLTMSEHFYNTSGREQAGFNLQVGIPDISSSGFIYKGAKSYRNPIEPNNNSISSTFYPAMNIWKISESTTIHFDAGIPSKIPEIPRPLESNIIKYRNNECVMPFKGSSTYILNTVLDSTFFTEVSSSYLSYEFMTKNNQKLVVKSGSGSSEGKYYDLRLNKDDILILVPSTPYSSDTNKFILITQDIYRNLVSYVLFFSDAIGIPGAYQCMEVYYGDPIPFKELKIEGKEIKSLVEVLSNFVTLEEVYYSDASGLLNGYFCVPQEVEPKAMDIEDLENFTNFSQGRRVTKWRYTKPIDTENSYYIGRYYNKGAFLKRGSILDEPLKLTESDEVLIETLDGEVSKISGIDNLKAQGFKGKAEVYYQSLLNRESIFAQAFSTELDFSNWMELNNPLTKLYSVVTYNDIDNSSNIRNATKLKNAQSYEDFDTYINNFCVALNTPGLLDLQEASNAVSAEETTSKGVFFNIFSRKTDTYTISDDVMETYFNAAFHISFNMRNKEDFSVNHIKMMSPYELFAPPSDSNYQNHPLAHDYEDEILIDESTGKEYVHVLVDYYYEDWPANPILVYPSHEDEYPINMILLSRKDILDKDDTVTLWNNVEDKYVMFDVIAKNSCLPSQINRVRYIGKDMESDINISKETNYSLTYTRNYETYEVFEKPIYVREMQWCYVKDDKLDIPTETVYVVPTSYKYVSDDEVFAVSHFDSTPEEGNTYYAESLGGSWSSTFSESSTNYKFDVLEVNGDDVHGTLEERKKEERYIPPHEDETHYYDKYGYEVSEGDPLAVLKTRIASINTKKGYYKLRTYEWKEADTQIVDHYETWSEKVSRDFPIEDRSHDCYIYRLAPKKIILDESSLGVDFYDEDNKKIDIKEDLFSSYMIPTVNKKNYFELLPPNEAKPNRYFLKNNASDMRTLRDSVIVVKMPKLVNSIGYTGMKALRDKQSLIPNESLRNFYGAFLNFYKDENNRGHFLDTLTELYRYLLGSIKMSDSKDNPLLFKEVKSTIENIKNLVPTLREALKSGIQVRSDKDNTLRVLTLGDIKGLERRILQHETYHRKHISVEDPNLDEIEHDPQKTFTQMLDTLLTHSSTEKDFINVTVGKDEDEVYWASFDEIVSALDTYEKEASLDDAKLLDSYFGNGTYPFLRLTLSDFTTNGLLGPFVTKYRQDIIDTIYKTGIVYHDANIGPSLASLKADYKKYFTDNSVDTAINENGDVDETKLILDIEGETYKEDIKSIFISYLNEDNSVINLIRAYVGDKPIDAQMQIVFFMFKPLFRNELTKRALSILETSNAAFEKSCEIYPRLTKETIEKYLKDYPLNMEIENGNYVIRFRLPTIVITEGEAKLQPAPLDDGGVREPIVTASFEYLYIPADVERTVFESLLTYIKYALSGVDDTIQDNPKPAMGIEMSDDKNVPHLEGLYGMRYQILNSRMNRMNGPLWNAASTLINSSFFEDYKKISNNTIDSYAMFADVLPIAKMDKMTYLPERDATMTSVPLKGKYYSDEEMESLRNLINSQCVLTCTKCNVKESCIFYDQKEVIDMACTPMETIDIYLKDNELELLVEDSIELQKGKNTDSSVLEGDYFDLDRLRTSHMEYGEILAKKSESNQTSKYDVLDIDNLNEELIRTTGLGYNDFVNDNMRWLLGGRYGTIEYNGVMRDLMLGSYPELKDSLPIYKYCYDALFIKTTGNDNSKVSKLEDKVPYMLEDSYIGYRESANAYPVSYELGPREQKKKYNVKTKIKIPAYIKMLHNANDSDDVYLVSDDTKDPNGRPIDPVIYLGKVKDIQYTFDIIEDDPKSSQGVTDPDDTNVYASDVAQWCINYMKGHCTDDPVGEPEQWHNRDQYWMPFVYKELYDEKGVPYWSRFSGRPRIDTGYQEPVIEIDNYDDISAISGKPVMNTYCDFVRKVSIRIYDPNIADENSRWLIPWVNENMPPQIPDKSITTLEKKKEFQRTILPLMKTNLRLVVIKS